VKEIGDRIEYLGYISHNEIMQQTDLADVIVALYDPKIPNNLYASPNKLFEAMMLKKPIIINSETTASMIVKRYNCGISIPYGSVDDLYTALQKLKNGEYRKVLGENGRIAYEHQYDWREMEKRILDVYGETYL